MMPRTEFSSVPSTKLLALSLYLLSFLALPAMSVPAPAPLGDLNNWNQYQIDEQPSETRYVQIHPKCHKDKCLDVRGGVFADGTPVIIYDCNDTPAQKWSIQRGTTKVKVAGQNFCLDAGTNPMSGTQMKIWTCDDSLSAQAWYYTNDKRITLKGQGQCLDLTDGGFENYNIMQIWQCAGGDTNQIWTTSG